MTYIYAEKVSIQFPIYSGGAQRSFKKNLIGAVTGGVIGRDASKKISVKALDEISFEFHPGDRVGIMGSNGSGKSTLLQMLSGVYEPTDGVLNVVGKIVPMLNLTLGLDMEFSGLENIYLRAQLLGLSRKQIEGKLEDIVEFSGIGDFIHLPMRTYSSGMVMRLMFSIVTSVDSDIILMDEWMSVGDSNFAAQAEIRLRQMMSDAKIVVIASHDINMLKKNCNKMIKLEHGKIVE
jgi:lipopolysaccharide transport system ATP-binding protein